MAIFVVNLSVTTRNLIGKNVLGKDNCHIFY